MDAKVDAAHIASLFKSFRGIFQDLERSIGEWTKTVNECDELIGRLPNLSSRSELLANPDTSLGVLEGLPRIRERLLHKQLEQVGLIHSAVKYRMFVCQFRRLVCVHSRPLVIACLACNCQGKVGVFFVCGGEVCG
jgi:hypothetical protein